MKVLIIDDNSTIYLTVKALLKKMKYINDEDIVDNRTSTNFTEEEYKHVIPKYELIICDFDLGNDCINGIEFFNILYDYGINSPKKVLLTANDSFILQSLMDMNTEITYIVKEELSSKEDVLVNLGDIINNIKTMSVDK